ncbi:MAG: 7-cyano-7-deazaguanine synthase [Acidobacteriota bacterium]
MGVNALDYSVSGEARVWVRNSLWAKPMPIAEFYELPDDKYETVAVDPNTLQIKWHRVTGRSRHRSEGKRCFSIRLERGQEITITQDHSLFTIDPITARLIPIKGSDITVGTPIVVPFDFPEINKTWLQELSKLDIHCLPEACKKFDKRWSITLDDGYITNRLKLTRIPIQFPITDDFLYIIGLWLAEGGKSLDSEDTSLAFSIGSIPGAVDTLRRYFERFGVPLGKSPANNYDYCIHSSVFAALFWYLGLFGTAKEGQKAFPNFFWKLSQHQRRVIIAGLWDGDGSHVFNGESSMSQKSHQLIHDTYYCLSLDGIFPVIKDGRHSQKQIIIRRSQDFRRLTELYPFRHTSKRIAYEAQAAVKGRDQATGIWKCAGIWNAVSSATLPSGAKTNIYNAGGKYNEAFRAQRSAFASVPSLLPLVSSKLAFLRVSAIQETCSSFMYDLSVEGAENFVANGILAHNSGYPDCRPEYIEAFELMANLATKAGVEGRLRLKIHTPLIRMTKAEIIKTGLRLGVDYSLTHSCYDPVDSLACGRCDSCQLRLKGFREAAATDPLRYVE